MHFIIFSVSRDLVYSCEKSSILFFFFFCETFSFFLPFNDTSIREKGLVRCSGEFLFHGDSRDSVAERRMLLPSVKEEIVRRVVSLDGFLRS